MLNLSFIFGPRKINGEKLTMMCFTFLDASQLPSGATWKVNFKMLAISNCVRST
jgi:hypothetical protein